jgi:SNF2 family DNA or RNA helicase
MDLSVEARDHLGAWRIRVDPGRQGIFRGLKGSRYLPFRKEWEVPATPMCALALSELVHVHGNDFDLRRYHDLVEMGKRIMEGDVVPTSTDWKPRSVTDTWEHQLTGGEHMNNLLGASSGGCLLYYDMGTGKTKMVLDLIDRRQFERTLVVAPLSVVSAWETQVFAHYPDLFRVTALDKGSSKKKREIADRELQYHGTLDLPYSIIVINYESFSTDAFADFVKEYQFDLVVADEAHKLKGRSTKQGKIFASMYLDVPYRVALTGTPLSAGKLTDGWGIMRFVDPGLFGLHVSKFEAIYSIKPPNQHFVVRWINHDQFNEIFWRLTIHQGKEVLDLPPWVDVKRTVTIHPCPQYTTMEEDLVAYLGSEVVVAQNAAVKVGKLLQITGGSVRDEDGTVHELHSKKEKELGLVLDEIGDEPVVVFALFRSDIERAVRAAKPRKVSRLDGDHNTLKVWQGGNSQVMVVQYQSGSLGIDLTRARHCIFYGLTYSLSDYEQARARVHRPGQEESVVYTHIIAEHTIDEVVMGALQDKQDVVMRVLSGGVTDG